MANDPKISSATESSSPQGLHLPEERRATLHALELAATLGAFEQSLDSLDSVESILQEAAAKLAGLISFKATAFYLVDEETFGFFMAWCSESAMSQELDIEVRKCIEDRSFAWALGRNKPSMISSDPFGRIMLHSLTSASGPQGMFVGIPSESASDTDIGYYLLTVALFSTSTMLENYQLYQKLARANSGLEQQVAERTKELTQSNEQLRDTLEVKEAYRQNLEAVFTSLQDALITVDVNRELISVNRAAEKFLGTKAADVLGKHFADVAPFCAESCMQVFAGTLDQGQIVRDFRAKCRYQGYDMVLSLSCSPLVQEDGSSAGAVLVIRDNTRLANLERQLKERHSFRNIVGRSSKMQELYNMLETLAEVDATVLVTGESGTGKELVADALHHNGARTAGPLVKVNCTALSENLLESELFGHVRGAFTGAVKDKPGRFEAAEGGTIFLDEIGDISLRIQVLLLRFLESKEFERVGDTVTRRADVRIVAATNADLTAKVQDGSFRADLFYRLNVMQVHLPPLRERRDDIPMLVEHFIRRCNKELNTEVNGMSEEAMGFFMRYTWPGNVRELKHAVEHACILAREDVIGATHLAPEIMSVPQTPPAMAMPSPNDFVSRQQPQVAYGYGVPQVPAAPPVRKAFHDLTAEQITEAVAQAGGNKSRAAQILGIGRATLYRKISELDLSL